MSIIQSYKMSWLKIWMLKGWLAWLAAIVAVTMSNPESSIVDDVPNGLHVTAGNFSDPNGYVMFCPCMGK